LELTTSLRFFFLHFLSRSLPPLLLSSLLPDFDAKHLRALPVAPSSRSRSRRSRREGQLREHQEGIFFFSVVVVEKPIFFFPFLFSQNDGDLFCSLFVLRRRGLRAADGQAEGAEQSPGRELEAKLEGQKDIEKES
jgi:hypothetical protein